MKRLHDPARRWRLSDLRHRRLDAWGSLLFAWLLADVEPLEVEPPAGLLQKVLTRLEAQLLP